MNEYKIKVNGNSYGVTIDNVDGNVAEVVVNGTHYKVEMEGLKAKKAVAKPATVVARPDVKKGAAPVVSKPKSAGGANGLKSPLPGTVLDIMVKEGDTVKAGQHLLLLEAMKMENNIDSEVDGVVKTIHVGKGDPVLEGDVLITIE